jgi:hypothetical protein
LLYERVEFQIYLITDIKVALRTFLVSLNFHPLLGT